jgi:non-heme chloroperoxidase
MTADRALPLDETGERLPGLISDVQLAVVEGGPNAIAWTHADQVNTALRSQYPAAAPPPK